MCYSVGAPTGEAFIEPNQERASPKGPALFLFAHHSRKHPTAEGSPAIPIYPAPPKSALTLSRPLRCRKLSAGKCTHPLTPALLSARAAPGRGPYPNHSTALTPGTEAPGAAGRQPAQAPLFLLGACATCRPLACRLAWAGEAPYHSPGQNARVKCTAPPLFLLGGAALAFCPRLLRQGAHPEGTGPLPWPVGPAGPRAGLARRQSDAAQLGPLYDGGAKLGRLLKRGRARRVAPAGLYPPLGRKRPAPWLAAGGPAGPGVPAGTGPTINGSSPLLPCWEPHYSTASRVCARRSRPATHPAGGHICKPPAYSPAAALRRAVPLFCVGPALDCAVLPRHCPTGQKGAQHNVYHR